MRIFKQKKEKNNSKWETHSLVEFPVYVIKLNKKNFEEFIKKYPLSIVYFWASWNTLLKTMKPRLIRLSNIYKEKVAFAKFNIEEYSDDAKKYDIMSIPHLILFRYKTKNSNPQF